MTIFCSVLLLFIWWAFFFHITLKRLSSLFCLKCHSHHLQGVPLNPIPRFFPSHSMGFRQEFSTLLTELWLITLWALSYHLSCLLSSVLSSLLFISFNFLWEGTSFSFFLRPSNYIAWWKAQYLLIRVLSNKERPYCVLVIMTSWMTNSNS